MNLRTTVILGFFMIGLVRLSAAGMPVTVPADTLSYEQRLDKGIEAFYQSDWNEAFSVFQYLQQKYPGDARAYFFSSMIPFWKYYFGGKKPSAAHAFYERSEKALTVSHNQLQSNPYDTTMVLMLSGLHGYRSLVAAGEEDYRRAIESGMDGFTYTRQLLKLDAQDPKALIGKGMFYYMMGSVPDQLKWVARFAGFSGDRAEGFRALEEAARSNSYVRNDAKMILSYLYEREHQEKKALEHLRELAEKYPRNIIFQYHTGRLYEKCGKIDLARKKYKLVASMDEHSWSSMPSKSLERFRNLSGK
ncbi:tetratricopeptide repeat protein [Fodinibius sediminis]|uniref:Uncharacterized protein n=1 Tax=Fodinibius sediminis TaxID=1214077 RepID=A0A521F4W7_9BACT|nr:tetratricopeptide repeat protein [Fodinibius sediminis]SMO90560.1 Protein of unknown function [Fodinibius sediminis]